MTDRDKLFTSNFWKTVIAELGIKHAMSTAFHPQTDRQTERANQTLEAYLRHYVSYQQDNWVRYLAAAQLAINNQVSSTTGKSPFFANYGRHPDLYTDAKDSVKAQEGMITAAE